MAVALALLAPLTKPKLASPQPNNPTAADKAALLQAIAECPVHPGAIYFIQYAIPFEPVIK